MFGLNILLLALSTLCDYHHIRHGKIKLACDNDSSLSLGLESLKRHNTTESYFDLVWALQERRQKIPIRIIPTQVAGHREKETRKLTVLEKINIEMAYDDKILRKSIK